MHEPLRSAFEAIHATHAQKQHTLAFLQQAQQRGRYTPRRLAPVLCAVALLLAVGLGGWSFYHVPVALISIDINPSVELRLNRLDRVVQSTAYNEDGEALLQDLALKGLLYIQAVEQLLGDSRIQDYLAQDGLLTFTVAANDEQRLLEGIRGCHGYPAAETECHQADRNLAAQANSSGMSLGKYRAYLALRELDDTVTPEQCRDMSMRELRDRTQACQQQKCGQNGQGGGKGEHRHGGGHD